LLTCRFVGDFYVAIGWRWQGVSCGGVNSRITLFSLVKDERRLGAARATVSCHIGGYVKQCAITYIMALALRRSRWFYVRKK
jgi:hypothetical protein